MAKEKPESNRKRVKISTDVIKMSDQDVGFTIEGRYLGKQSAPWTDRDTGEEKELTRVFFEREDGTKFLTFEDAGLRNAMANAMVKEGDLIAIEKREQVDLGKGRRSNQYDIFQLV